MGKVLMEITMSLDGYVAGPDVAERVETAVYAESLGYSSAWAAEAYGSDVPTLLSWIGARTTTLELGTAILQIPGRTPAMTAMTAATLDRLSEGRVRLGLGVSGPQVSEGWHGVKFDKPLARTREYVEIVRTILAREEPLNYAGEHFTLPLPDGPGKPLKIMLHPYRSDIPIYLAAVGPKNLELTGRIADGWLSSVDHKSIGKLYIATCFVWFLLTPFAEASEHTTLQKVVPYERQGRVFGFAQSVEQAAAPLTAFVVGPLTQIVVAGVAKKPAFPAPRSSCARRAARFA